MKKKLCMLVLALCMTVSVTACGGKETTTSGTEAKDEDTKENKKEEDSKNESSAEMIKDTRMNRAKEQWNAQ